MMGMKWRDLNSIQRSQLAGVGAIAILTLAIVAINLRGNSSKAAQIEMAAEAASDAPVATASDSGSSSYAPIAIAPSVPPTAVVDGVTYTGEQQIEALTQAAREAGLSEAEAPRAGREAAILCNGNPECLR